MKRIMICCSGGITSKIFIRKLKQYAENNNIEMEFSAISESFLKQMDEMVDVVLFAPQTRPSTNRIEELKRQSIVVGMIPEDIYASMECEAIFNMLDTLEKHDVETISSKPFQKLSGFLTHIAKNNIMEMMVTASFSIGSLMIAQSLFSLILSFPLGDAYQSFLQSTGLRGILEIPVTVLSNMVSLIFCFAIGYSFNRGDAKERLFSSLLCVAAFLLLLPIDISNVGSLERIYRAVIDLKYLNYSGIFISMLVSIVYIAIYHLISNKIHCRTLLAKEVVICLSILLIFLGIRTLFMYSEYKNIFEFLNSMIALVLQPISKSVWGYFLFITISSCLCLIGIHGPMLVYSLILPLHMTIFYANITAFSSGMDAPYPVWMLTPFVFLGGAGATLGLNILMIWKAKSAALKKLGKLAVFTSFFNINEPLIYGVPIAFNPMMAIPFIFTPICNLFICLLVMYVFPVVPLPTGAELSTYLPFAINGMLTVQHIGGCILSICILLIDMVIYYPFFLICDNTMHHVE